MVPNPSCPLVGGMTTRFADRVALTTNHADCLCISGLQAGQFSVAVAEGTPIGDVSDWRFDSEPPVPAINNRGEVVFVAISSDDRASVFASDRRIARPGQIVDGETIMGIDAEHGQVAINDRGQVAYSASLASDPKVIVFDDNIVFESGAEIDGEPVSLWDQGLAVNDTGVVAFVGRSEQTVVATADEVLFRTGDLTDGRELGLIRSVRYVDSQGTANFVADYRFGAESGTRIFHGSRYDGPGKHVDFSWIPAPETEVDGWHIRYDTSEWSGIAANGNTVAIVGTFEGPDVILIHNVPEPTSSFLLMMTFLFWSQHRTKRQGSATRNCLDRKCTPQNLGKLNNMHGEFHVANGDRCAFRFLIKSSNGKRCWDAPSMARLTAAEFRASRGLISNGTEAYVKPASSRNLPDKRGDWGIMNAARSTIQIATCHLPIERPDVHNDLGRIVHGYVPRDRRRPNVHNW